MRIYYVAYIRLPTEKAHGAQIMKTCEALAAGGAEVELVIPGRKTPIGEDPFAHYGVRPHFAIVRCPAPDWVEWGPLGYALGQLWFSERARLRKSFWSADYIYSRDAFVLLQYVLLGRRTVYEAHTAPTVISTLAARFAKVVVVISEGLRDAYVHSGVSESKIVVAHDAVDVGAFHAPIGRDDARRRLGIPPNKTVALYVGRIDGAKGAGTLAEASEHLPDTHQVVLVGSGPLKDMLATRYPKVLYLPETPYRDLPQVLAAGDILVIPNSAKDEDMSRYTSPLKAFAYLAARKPIIASDVPALRFIFKDTVRYVRPDDAADLRAAITDPHTLHTISSIAPPSWDTRAEHILRALETQLRT